MIGLARDIIGTQPILTAFLAIGLGYLVGQISIGSFSLGVGAVLFVGLALGAFAPKAQITGPIGLIGLIMFLYGVGILYGRQFFEGMTGAAGRKYNFLAFVGVIAGLVVALGLGRIFGGLSLRGHWADFMHLFYDAPGAAEISPKRTANAHGRNHTRPQLDECHLRRPPQRPAEWYSSHDGEEEEPERCTIGRAYA